MDQRPTFLEILEKLKAITVPEPPPPARAGAVAARGSPQTPPHARAQNSVPSPVIAAPPGQGQGQGQGQGGRPAPPARGPSTPAAGAGRRPLPTSAPTTPSRTPSAGAAGPAPTPAPRINVESASEPTGSGRPLPRPVPVAAAGNLAATARARKGSRAIDRTSRFSWFKRSPSTRMASNVRSEAIANLGCNLQFDQMEKFIFAVEDVLAPNCLGGWYVYHRRVVTVDGVLILLYRVLVGYQKPTTLALVDTGVHVRDLVEKLVDTQVLCSRCFGLSLSLSLLVTQG
jgi:hypothetical protein